MRVIFEKNQSGAILNIYEIDKTAIPFIEVPSKSVAILDNKSIFLNESK